MSAILRFLSFILIITSFSIALSGCMSVAAATPNVDKIKANDCTSSKTELTVLALMTPSKFFPIIPIECGGNVGEGPKAMSLKALPIILIRVYGLLASLVFFLFGFNLVFASVRFSFGAFQEAEYKNSLNMIQEGATSVALVLLAHLIISTIFSSVLKIPLNTDMSSIQQLFT